MIRFLILKYELDDLFNEYCEPNQKKNAVKLDNRIINIREDFLEYLYENYSDLIPLFDGDINNLLQFCFTAISELQNQHDFNRFNKDNMIGNENNKITDLTFMILDNLNNSGSLIKHKHIFYSDNELNKLQYSQHIVDVYLENENAYINKICIENLNQQKITNQLKRNQSNNDDIANKEDEFEDRGLSIHTKKYIINVIEVSLIIMLITFIYYLINNVSLKELSIFNSKILDVFDESDYCINKFKTITSSSGMNIWIKECYLTT